MELAGIDRLPPIPGVYLVGAEDDEEVAVRVVGYDPAFQGGVAVVYARAAVVGASLDTLARKDGQHADQEAHSHQ
ncbi:hypothetical protein [Neomoorella thermoacetica]|uniref:hypothetical protein n=1 Tax=Neomoorella thermoacetica TaxID=1525 RepID=UPI001E5BB03C|nr:hypothetical protein [Moorella thermoacetica]